MGRSDRTGSTSPERRLRRRLPVGAVALVTLLSSIVAGCGVPNLTNFDADYDHREMDRIERAFEGDREAFEAAVARMQEFVADHPDAEQIGWTGHFLCLTTLEAGYACEDGEAADLELIRRVPGIDGVVYQVKDGDRVYFRFNLNHPPVYHLMFAPDDPDPESFADDRGFRAHRELSDGWTLLGPIEDRDQEDAQWP